MQQSILPSKQCHVISWQSELAYHAGDSLFLFLKGTGSTAPKLRVTLRIRRLPGSAETLAPIEQSFGVVTRAFDGPPEIDRQQNVMFADYQRYCVALFTQPLLVADVSSEPGVAKGVVENRVILGEVPGEYIATIELFDETTKSSTKTDIEFAIVPSRTTGAGQGRDQTGDDEVKRLARRSVAQRGCRRSSPAFGLSPRFCDISCPSKPSNPCVATTLERLQFQ